MNLLAIIRTASAEEDLIATWLHIARDDEAAADRLLDRIEARWQQLATYPLYRVGEGAVEILRVLHGNIEADDLAS